MSIPIPMSERVKAFWRRWSARESAANGVECTPTLKGVSPERFRMTWYHELIVMVVWVLLAVGQQGVLRCMGAM